MKCFFCKKKLGVLTFTCRCEKHFCVTCRLPEIHTCPVSRQDPVVLEKVVAEKVSKV